MVVIAVVITAVVDAVDDAEPDSLPTPAILFVGPPLLVGTSDAAVTAGSTAVRIAKGIVSSHKGAAKGILTNMVMSVMSANQVIPPTV